MSFKTSATKIIDTLDSLNIEKIDNSILKLADRIVLAINNGGKVLICGNGGSAAEAEHFAAELVCKFQKVRKALPAITLKVVLP